MWQELRTELRSQGLEIVTVALDTGGHEVVRPWIEAAQPQHPSLIDQAHLLDELFGIVNVPSGLWIDEGGRIIRPPETAYPRRPAFLDRPVPAGASERQAQAIATVRKLRVSAEPYVAALRDWVARGAASRFALAPGEVLRRSAPRTSEAATAAACFELGQYLHRLGFAGDAVPHFRQALRLQPDNWTYKRQAWNLAGTRQEALYESDWLTEVMRTGPEHYYPPLDL